ncbi:GTP pyrophosphokinase [Sulfurivirga caldicuralii]|uniref:GTP pyrophosphokinase n=1 Tax=Sulfurivirga caldicuralii TaxID=364032 RepID=A0A1N6F9P4_9GAMM|nr:bifunctional (p)ppGpp synthetase/guanosine-3',5'-bis(diphosphate) 3'-pyrophosphohydrolase [Sulfurivirga caldicuralii]SIN91990.1 GTP pyrophosphokinase [Sulfurivirga caldicuralii]
MNALLKALEIDPKKQPLLAQAAALAHEALNLPQVGHVRSVEVAQVLHPLGVDEATLITALLSDRTLEPLYSNEVIAEQFGEEIGRLLAGVRQLNQYRDFDPELLQNEDQLENLRQMLLVMTSDLRMLLVKLAYRIVRLRHLKEDPVDVQRHVAAETLHIFAPLANRLGLGQLKWELEDLSFRYLQPEIYYRLAREMASKRSEREAYVEAFKQQLKSLLEEAGIEADITGRPKHLYSIWKKMQRKGHAHVDELNDLRAVRVFVDDVGTCYEVLGLVHTHWEPVPDEFDDYIAHPKENGYQSLHTVVIGPNGKMVEIQIRTHAMHQHAEFGVATHWRYKEGDARIDERLEQSLLAVRQHLETASLADLGALDVSVQSDRIYVLTPKGEVIHLPAGATVLDFAYAIHTELGHRTRGALVNGRIVPLTYALKNGEQVEVLTAREPRPNRNWLNPSLGYTRSPRTRAKIRSWFNKQDRSLNIEQGRQLLHNTLQRLNVKRREVLPHLLERFRLKEEESLLEQLGKGAINEVQLAAALQKWVIRQAEMPPAQAHTSDVAHNDTEGAQVVTAAGPLPWHAAKCCQPKPGEPIVGYVTRGSGITVHAATCPNILNLSDSERKRLIDVYWANEGEGHLEVQLKIVAHAADTLLMDLLARCREMDAQVKAINSHTEAEGTVRISLTVLLPQRRPLGLLLDRLEFLPGVIELQVTRTRRQA